MKKDISTKRSVLNKEENMIAKTKKKAIYKSALAVLLGGTMAMTSGCGNNSDETAKETGEVKENDKNNEDEGKTQTEQTLVPTEIMSVEETNKLSEGQFISAEELTKLPDAEALESRDLAFIYCYNVSSTPVDESTDVRIDDIEKAIGTALPEDEMHTTEWIGADKFYIDCTFLGIQIAPVVNYFYDSEKGQYIKIAAYGEYTGIETGIVTSDAKLNELGGNQKTLGQ